MRFRAILASAVLAGLFLPCDSAFAQDTPAPAVTPAGPRLTAPVPRLNRRRQIPCWQQVGVLPSVMQQVNGIRETMRGDIGTACADTSLSKEQKMDKIDSLHKSAHDKIDALIPSHQRQAMQSCEAARPRPSRIRRRTMQPTDPCGIAVRAPAAPDTTAPPDSAAPPAKDAAPEKDATPAKPADPKKTDDNSADDKGTDSKN